jgi:hypothetical protein
MRYTIGQVKELIRIAMVTFVAGEDNSWKCQHNLETLLRSVDDSIALEKVGQKIKEIL